VALRAASNFAADFVRLQSNIETVLVGKSEVVRQALVCFVAEGHLLLEDVPGVGKTSLARAIAGSLDATWRRIQFTPDLLPSDVTGISIYDQAKKQFVFQPGAIFANIVVADEINRASPKTQSALLEVMEEHQVTADGEPHAVPRPFMVVATQNPVDMDGTYALPEAQLDRFLMRLAVGYPSLTDEVGILATQGGEQPVVAPVMTVRDLLALRQAAAQVHVADALRHYLATVVASTRTADGVRLGASPRASLALQRACRVQALAEGREFVSPEDVKALAVPVLAHRLLLTSDALLRGETQASAVQRVLAGVPVPQVAAGDVPRPPRRRLSVG